MSDPNKILTAEEAANLFHKLEMKYGAEMKDIQQAMMTDATVYGFITPVTETRRQAFLRKILEENQMEFKGATPPPLAVVEAENVIPGNFGKKNDAT